MTFRSVPTRTNEDAGRRSTAPVRNVTTDICPKYGTGVPETISRSGAQSHVVVLYPAPRFWCQQWSVRRALRASAMAARARCCAANATSRARFAASQAMIWAGASAACA